MTSEEIFLNAIEKAAGSERLAYVEGACAGNTALREQVQRLLDSHDQAGSFLNQPLFDSCATLDQRPPSEKPGMQIGPYKLLQKLGEGGMGVVYMAEQKEPVERRVALKIIKPGMDTQQVIARFDAERQALALMDHPNIARVLDAGTTHSGRPYFVMELVKGVPITQYCDEHQLTPRERLELFLPVCQAVQHAHHKGIIHRDLKPTNVLVAEYDQQAVPKIIDFGVAKATGHRLTEKTMFTEFGQVVGTIEYMSPEQAKLNQLDIDTRTDIYSLGVLLYELLTGETPLDRQRLRSAAFDEMLRIIREEEPPRPSTRLSSSQTLASVAACRDMEPKKLSALVRGELDWIVMKSLEKDRNRRYETANALGMDIHRYLSDEQVLACPPSASYRLQKFARRNKAALGTAALVVGALVLGTVVSTWQAVRATNAEGLARTRLQAEQQARREAELARDGEAKQRKLADEQNTLARRNAAEAEIQRQKAEANFAKARQAVDEYLTQITENELLSVPGLQPLREDLLRAALKFYAEFTQERADDPMLRRELASAQFRLGAIQRDLGNGEEARAANQEAIRLFEQLRDQGQVNSDLQADLAKCYYYAGRFDDTVKLCQAALQVEPGHPEIRSLLAETYNSLAIAGENKNDAAAALRYHQQAFALREALVGDFPESAQYLAQLGSTVNNLGVLLSGQGKTTEALAMFERAVDYSAQAYEREPHSLEWGRWLCTGLRNVAINQAALNRDEEARNSYQRLVAVSRKRVFENPAVASLRADLCQAHFSLAHHQQQLGNADDAARSFRAVRDLLENMPRETAQQLLDLTIVYAALATPAEGAGEPNDEEAARRQGNADLAMETLKSAVDAGLNNIQTLKTNSYLEPLKQRDDFQNLLATLEKELEARQLAARNEGNTAQKLADRRQALAILQGLVSAEPAKVRHRSTLAATLQSIGEIQTGLNQFADAEKSLREALRLREDLHREEPQSAKRKADLGGTRARLADVCFRRGRVVEALTHWEAAFKLLDGEPDWAPGNNQLAEWHLQRARARRLAAAQNETLLTSFDSGEIVNADAWQRITDSRLAPPGTRLVRIRLLSMRYSGDNNDGYFDGLSFRDPSGRNLLTNPSAEDPSVDGQLSGWNAGGLWRIRMNDPQPYEGQAYFFASFAGPLAELVQDVDISEYAAAIDGGSQKFQFEGHVRSFAQGILDPARFIIEYRAAADDSSRELVAADYEKSMELLPRGEVLQEYAGWVSLNSNDHEADRTVLALVDRLAADRAMNPEFLADLITARMALGLLYWNSDRRPQAHQIWQECLARLAKLANDHPNDAALAAKVAAPERRITEAYGVLAIWELTGAHARQNAKLKRSTSAIRDAHFAALLPHVLDDKALREYCQVLDSRQAQVGASAQSAAALHLAWCAGLVNPPGLPSARLVETAQKAYDADPAFYWHPFCLALAQHRAGKHQTALEILDKNPAYQDWNSLSGQRSKLSGVFLHALVAKAAGQDERAREQLHKSETLYRRLCEDELFGGQKGLSDTITWWELAAAQILRREAWQTIEGRFPGDPWHRLIQAKGYQEIGENERADAELTAAVTETPNDPEVWMARARLAMRFDGADRTAELAWQRVVELAGDAPLPWIQRGRWYAERGEHGKADADFAKAASLTPNELNKFLEAGWWVVGPYPEGLQEFCPPEVDPDPARPVHTIDPKTGLSEHPVAWRSVPTGEFGDVDLRAAFNADHFSAYALNIIYSPDERSAMLRVGGDDHVRVWLNGRLVHEAQPASTWRWGQDGVPVTLRAGRNIVLAKVTQSVKTHNLTLRVADGGLDRAFALAEMGLWKEAATQMRQANPQGIRDAWLAAKFAQLLLAAGDAEGYQSQCEWMLQQFETPASSSEACNLAWAYTLAPDVAPDVERLVRLAVQGLDPGPTERYRISFLARALYRAGRFDEAIGRLGELTDVRNPVYDVVLAMAHYRRGDKDKARELLEKAQNWYDAATRKALAAPTYDLPHWHWNEFADFQILYREARELIEGGNAVEDKNSADLVAHAQKELAGHDPLVAEFDHALMVDHRPARHWLARGRRLAELARFDDAEADFNKAVELKPNDPDILAARAVFFADRGEPDKAAADFHAALSLFSDAARKPRWSFGVPIDLEVAQREDVFERLMALRPSDSRLLMTRMILRVQQGDFEGAQSDAKRLEPYGMYQPRAAHALWRGDHQEFERLRDIETIDWDPSFQIALLGLAPTEGPVTTRIEAAAERMWREQPQDRWHRRWLGLAQLRAGKLPEAVASLEASLAPGSAWQNDGMIWPLLAIAQHQSGNAELARRWLDKAAIWLDLRNEAEAQRVSSATNVGDLLPGSWLDALAFYLEAKALIDGPDAAVKARDRLAKQGQEKRQDAQMRAAAKRQDALAKAEAAWNRAVELAGDDPRPWIERGRFHAEQSQSEKAQADFAQAFKLDPNHPLCRLERARQNRTVITAWDFSRGTAGWRATQNCKIKSEMGALSIESTGPDPFIDTDLSAPAGWKELTLCVRFQDEMTVELFWATKSAGISQAQKVSLRMTGHADQWQEHRILFEPHAELVGLRFDPPNEGGGRIDLAWMMLANLSDDDAKTLSDGPAEAARLQQEQKYAEAAAVWTRFLALKPSDPEALRGRAAACFALGRFDEVIADRSALAKAATGTPAWAQALIARGAAKRAARDTTGALADFSEVLARLEGVKSPGLVGAAEYERCVTWLAAGDVESLKGRCRELMQSTPSDQAAVYVVACCKQHPQSVEDWSAVLGLARRCVRNNPDHELYKKNLVAALCRSGKHEEALAYAAEAFRENPSIGTQLWIAMSHAALGQLDEARRVLAAAEARNEAAITVGQVELRLMAAEVRSFLEAREKKAGQSEPGPK